MEVNRYYFQSDLCLSIGGCSAQLSLTAFVKALVWIELSDFSVTDFEDCLTFCSAEVTVRSQTQARRIADTASVNRRSWPNCNMHIYFAHLTCSK